MEVYCNWLTPTHVAALSMEVYEPLSLSCLEHSSGGFAFLQLFLANTCPLPLLIRHPSLNAPGLDLNGLHGNLPMVSKHYKKIGLFFNRTFFLPSRESGGGEWGWGRVLASLLPLICSIFYIPQCDIWAPAIVQAAEITEHFTIHIFTGRISCTSNMKDRPLFYMHCNILYH